MQFKLTEKEITAGIHHAVGLMGFDLSGKHLTVTYSMTGRAKNHLNAEVTITNPAVQGEDQVVIPGFTDTDEVKEDNEAAPVPSIAELDENKPAAEEVKVEATETKTEPVAQGADAAALFGDDD